MRGLLVFLFLALFLVVAVVVYAPYTSVSYSDSDSHTLEASWSDDLPQTVSLYLSAGVGNARELVPGGYTCYARSGFDVRAGGLVSWYVVSVERVGEIHSGFYGLYEVDAQIDDGYHSEVGTYTTTGVETGFASMFKSPGITVSLRSCTGFPCSLSASLWAEAGCGLGGGSSGGGGGGSSSADVRFYVVGDAGGADWFPFWLDGPRWGGNGSSVSVPAGLHSVGVAGTGFTAYDTSRRLLEEIWYNGSGRIFVSWSYGTYEAGGARYAQLELRAAASLYSYRGVLDVYLGYAGPVEAYPRSIVYGAFRVYVEWVDETTLHVRFELRRRYYGPGDSARVYLVYRAPVNLTACRAELWRGNTPVASSSEPRLTLSLNASSYTAYIYLCGTRPRGFYVVPGGLVYVSNLTGVGEPVVRPLTGPAGDVEFTVYRQGDFEATRFRPDGSKLSR